MLINSRLILKLYFLANICIILYDTINWKLFKNRKAKIGHAKVHNLLHDVSLATILILNGIVSLSKYIYKNKNMLRKELKKERYRQNEHSFGVSWPN